MNRQSIWFIGPGRVEIREEAIQPAQAGQMLVQTRLSAISPGTELLFYRGQVPEELALDGMITGLSGAATFPFKYGYSAVGEVVDLGPGVEREWLGKRVFSFHPHESHFLVQPGDVMLIPHGVSWEDAVFLPNMETAVNFVMDGAPLIGETVAVFGLGIVGLLTTALTAQLPLALLIGLDPISRRRLEARQVGAGMWLDPLNADGLSQAMRAAEKAGSPGGVDLVFECSGSPAALDQAIAMTGFDGRIVIGSWYGKKSVQLNLGGKYHRSRIRLISSQVTTLASALTGRWTKQRRFLTAWEQIRRIKPSRWITQRTPLVRANEAFQQLDEAPEESIQVVLDYR